jgi:hypothetical protein
MANEKIIFDGGICKVIEEKVLFHCTTEDMLDQYRAKIPIKTRLMPNNTVYYERRENMTSVYVIGYTPRLMRVKWKENNNVDIYRVSMPFLYYAISCKEENGLVKYIFPCCTTKQISSLKDEVFAAPIPNIHGNGQKNLCTGEIRYDVSWDITRKVNHLMNEIYSSTWNQDLSFEFPAGIRGFKDWNEKSMQNGLLWNTLKYRKHEKRNFEGIVSYAFEFRGD